MLSRNVILPVALVLALLVMAPPSQASTIFFDDFNGDHGGTFIKNFRGFSNWTVRRGFVDLVGIGSEWDWFKSSNHLYIDLDGSGRIAGQLTTRNPISLPGAGRYALGFDLAGSQRRTTESMTYLIVDHNTRTVYATGTITLAPDTPFTHHNIPFTVTRANEIDLIFFEPPGSPNHIGLLLDNVGVYATPVPPSFLLLGTGLLGLGVLGWRRKRNT